MKRIAHVFHKLNWGRRASAVFVLCATTAAIVSAQTFTTLFSFNGGTAVGGHNDGNEPLAALRQGTDGNLYGTTAGGGAFGGGTIFMITTGGTPETLYNFCGQPACADGSEPYAGLVQAANGDFYGTTYHGGNGASVFYTGYGTVFKITPSGALTALYSFCAQSGCPDGASPYGGLVEANNGDFYGTTYQEGVNNPLGGTLFRITPSGALTTLYTFCAKSSCGDGQQPAAALIQANNGDLYGTTPEGGVYSGEGTIFETTPSGTLTTLFSFCGACLAGGVPYASLVQATNGDLYGTATGGGTYDGGTVFKITTEGALTTLYSFCTQTDCTDGSYPWGLIQATDGNFYGTTFSGGAYGHGTIFEMTPRGALKTLYSFCAQSGCTDGANPYAALVQDTNGTFYGTTSDGGTYNVTYPCDGGGCGTVFSLSVGLSPFVKTQPTSGKVAAAVKILGTDLTGATSVSFNGTEAAFTVNSTGSAISTSVPAGATTGTVQVVTPTGALSSNVPFRVLR